VPGSSVEHPCSFVDNPAPGCTSEEDLPRPPLSDPADSSGKNADIGGTSTTPFQRRDGGDDCTHGGRGSEACDKVTGALSGGHIDGRDLVTGRGYSLTTFRVVSCVHPHRTVAPGSEVLACLGRNVYLLWSSSRRRVPSTVDAFRAAGPSCILLERGSGALRIASKKEGTAGGVLHPDRLIFLRGKEGSFISGTQDVSEVQLLLEAPSATLCKSWVTGARSLLTPWEAMVGAGLSGWNEASSVHDLLLSVLPPLPEVMNDQLGTTSRMLGRCGRRFVLKSQHWLSAATSGAPAAAGVILQAADAVDQVSFVPIVGPALRLGLLVVQVGALALLAEGHDSRRKDTVGKCEGVALDLLCRIFEQLREDPTEFGAAVEQLCSLMAQVESVLEEVEATFFMAPAKDAGAGAVIQGWEQRLSDIYEKQITSGVHGAIGRAVERLQHGVDGLMAQVTTPQNGVDGLMAQVTTPGQSFGAGAPVELDLSKYEVGWRPPALSSDHVTGVNNPNRVEFAILSVLNHFALGEVTEAPRVGVCAIGGSGKSTACAEVASSQRVRTLFPRGTVWVQLNDAFTMETVTTAVTALVYHLCGEATARRFQRLTEREDYVSLAAAEAQASSVAHASERLVIIDDVCYDQVGILKQLLLVVPQTTPVVFTTRSEMVVASVTGAVRLATKSWPEDDARALLARAVGKWPTKSESVFSEEEEAAWVLRVLDLTQCHVLSVSIVAALVSARCGMWRPVVEALERQWTDPSFQRPLNEPSPRRSVRATLDTSRALLPDDKSRRAFAALGILPANEQIGLHVLERLWRPQLCVVSGAVEGSRSLRPERPSICDDAVHPGVLGLVEALVRAGLLHQEVADGELMGVVVHPVIGGYAHSLLGENCAPVHQRLVDEHARECAADNVDTHGWLRYHFWATPDDGYWYNNVARHAAASEDVMALASLATSEWRTARTRTGPRSGYQADVEVVLASLRAIVDDADHSVRDSPVLLGAAHWGLAMAYLYRMDCKTAAKHEVAIILLRRGLDELPRFEAPLLWAEMQNDLGNAYAYRVNGNKAANFQRAVGCYYRALDVRTREAAPSSWAETQHCLGMIYAHRHGGNKATNLMEAMACFRRALDVRTREIAPLQWAETTRCMGGAYADWVDGDKAAYTEEALACYRRALEVFTRVSAPLHWAKTLHSMGTVFAARLDGDKAANMEKALACYRQALEARAQDIVLVPWAMTQSCMGAAYLERENGDKEANLEEAVACYMGALDVWTRETMPLQWTSTQLKLANIYKRMGGNEESKQGKKMKMMACYRRTLEVWTREAAPHDWATMQNRMAKVCAEQLDGDKAANMEDALVCYRLALEVWTRETAPLHSAEVQHGMGTVYAKRLNGDKAANLEEALACYRSALEVWTRETSPLQWSTAQYSMGVTYAERLDGDKAANMEHALACYRQALEVWTPETVPLDWAKTQNGMGAVFLERLDGDKAANMEEALACYRRALEVWTRETSPLQWATAQYSMGVTYAERLDGDKANNIEMALACYLRSLDVWTCETVPLDWAKAQHGMGASFFERLDGDKAANIEEALACYRRALKVWSPKTEPLLFAEAQHSMGTVYAERLDGDKAANWEEALGCCRLALEVWTRETTPLDWAAAQHRMGAAFSHRVDGDKAANWEEALACYRRAIKVWTRETAPLDWAKAQHHMGAAYSQRVDGDKAANWEDALASYRCALLVWTPETAPLHWANTQHSMGAAYVQRVDGNRAVNLEEALACYNHALEVWTRETAPLHWASAQYSMSAAYVERVDGDKAANLEEALACYRRALELWTHETAPLNWARAQRGMGAAYSARLDGDKAANMEEALACYRRSLHVCTLETTPLDWAKAQHGMGVAYSERLDGDEAANMEQASACYSRALEVWTRRTSPLQWASTQLNLGDVNRRRMTDDGVPDVDEALACIQRALEVLTPDVSPLLWSKAQHSMGLTYEERVVRKTSNLDKAVACYRRALKVRTRETVPEWWASSTWRMLLALQCSEQWAEALEKARALQAFGRKWKRWDEFEASLATRVTELEREVARSPGVSAIHEP